MIFFYPRDVLDEIWDLLESVSVGFPTYSHQLVFSRCKALFPFIEQVWKKQFPLAKHSILVPITNEI